MARFCIRTGKVLSPPATVPLSIYQVRVEDGDVYVCLE
jgi:nitrite reductase/ring-hydroxylating ferredoxin subunit